MVDGPEIQTMIPVTIFEGYVVEVKIYYRALNLDEINNLYTIDCP